MATSATSRTFVTCMHPGQVTQPHRRYPVDHGRSAMGPSGRRAGWVMKGDYRVLDADVHVIEPMSMWAEHIDPKFRGREPQPEDLAFGMLVDGIPINTWTARDRDLDDAARDAQGTDPRDLPGDLPRGVARGFDAAASSPTWTAKASTSAFLYPSFGLFVIASNEIDPTLAAADRPRLQRLARRLLRGRPRPAHAASACSPSTIPPAAAAEVARACTTSTASAACSSAPNPILGRNLDDPVLRPGVGGAPERAA